MGRMKEVNRPLILGLGLPFDGFLKKSTAGLSLLPKLKGPTPLGQASRQKPQAKQSGASCSFFK